MGLKFKAFVLLKYFRATVKNVDGLGGYQGRGEWTLRLARYNGIAAAFRSLPAKHLQPVFRGARCLSKTKIARAEKPDQADDDQINGNDIIQQAGHDQDKYPGKQRYQGGKTERYIHRDTFIVGFFVESDTMRGGQNLIGMRQRFCAGAHRTKQSKWTK